MYGGGNQHSQITSSRKKYLARWYCMAVMSCPIFLFNLYAS
ncbi:hypothetical protein PROPEN_04980 [Proteus penneri ATCC 35198]|nr:hypothetical protein PROPEN_04980 [Proteus penneri ATCC 35198]